MARPRHYPATIAVGQLWRSRATKEVWEIVGTRRHVPDRHAARFIGKLEIWYYVLRRAGVPDIELTAVGLRRDYKLRGDGPSTPRPATRYDT